MLDFRTPALADKERIDRFVRRSGRVGCDISFANTYLWRDRYNIRVAFTDDAYFKCYCQGDQVSGYVLPMTDGDLSAAIGEVLADARERGTAPEIGLLDEAGVRLIKECCGDRMRIEENRDNFDYLYERRHLAELSGKKYHAKRNHLSRFVRNHIDHSVEEINEENFDSVLSVARRWQEHNADTGELDVIRDALAHFDELGLFGLVLYVDKQPTAMCIASEINRDVCDVHFEKAVDINEAYAVINREFALHYDRYVFVNREEDMGLEGLRKAKLSYHPDILLAKSTAFFEK